MKHRIFPIIGIFLLSQTSGLAQQSEGLRIYLTKKMASNVESYVKVVDNRAWQGGPIRVGGKTFMRGLGVHADSKLVFPLNAEYTTFRVVPGPDDAHHGQIEMKILVDETEVFTTGPTNSQDGTPRKPLSIPVTGAKTLTLIVTSADEKRGGDHASWADARLVLPWDGNPLPEQKPPAVTQIPRGKLEPFLREYCIECHGKRKQKGQVRFDEISWEIANNDTAQRWQDVLDQLNGGEMPPEEATQPFDDEMSAALDNLTGALLTARRRLTDHGGEIKMRRLNRREYFYTICDLFGFDINSNEIPEDRESSTFDTVGADQFFTSAEFERYLKLGREIAVESFYWNTQAYRPNKIEHRDLGPETAARVRKRVAENEAKYALVQQGKSALESGFKDEGDKEIFRRQYLYNTLLPKKYTQLPRIDQGRYLVQLFNLAADFRYWRVPDIRGDYIQRIHGAVVGNPPELHKHIEMRDAADSFLGALKLKGTMDKPESVEIRLRGGSIYRLDGALSAGHLLKTREIAGEFERSYQKEIVDSPDPQALNPPFAPLWVDWLEWEGPIYPKDRPKIEEILYPDGSTKGGPSPLFSDANAKELINQFAFEAFRRRNPEPDYLAGLHELFKKSSAEGLEFKAAMFEVYAVILSSPGFLYLQEANTEDTDASPYVDDLELANRLSYFLWSRPPDRQLYAFAKAEGLSKAAILKNQVDRMLNDPKSDAFVEGFMSQWGELDRFDAITVDPKEFPQFPEAVRVAAKQEVSEFFRTLVTENLPASNLIDSDFVTINTTLGAHYGIDLPNSGNSAFQKVKLPADSPRGGLMTQAAFLTTGSNGERSSPVIRGALVMEKLLHDEPAPPPPNVPELGSASKKPRTNREMVIAHQKQAVCASCHKKMDVIGFGLENFDPIGQWRDTEKVGDKDVPIQPAGTLPGGATFANVKQLKQVLMDNEDKLAKELVESILAYSLGRTIEFSDSDDVEQLLAKLKADNYGVRSIIREIAMSDLFRRK